MTKRFALLAVTLLALWPIRAMAQQAELTVATVTRPPFSMPVAGADQGFSIDLWEALAKKMNRSYRIERFDSFGAMLKAVETGQADLAIANISITASREQVMDFSQPIFASGLQIMTQIDNNRPSPLMALMSRDLLLAIVLAFGALMGLGMLMWSLERRSQAYFDHPAKQAMFPAFWWALNLVVNGGFEERVPRTFLGRILSVTMVLASLFFVSVFVAYITAAMTVEAITTNVQSINDLYGKKVGTISGSTAASFLQGREMDFVGFAGLEEMLVSFEDGALDAVVFDAPILAYYVNTRGKDQAVMTGQVFLRETYGVAAPSGSPMIEEINRTLLALREDGAYAEIYKSWFGTEPR
ncbi:transporter substrate-binding domain-containing protein [Thalassovita taeanensis]|uniref:Amino acid ABC transporter substrate-binding protein, PAAT family n=1 Tax=Thalassovita taeanensis TaxID=657014 RepID=A0A1H9DUE2_9RHOB|nr:transporter substrate-binding domain-containing protein [Thalassovita taeanensis]SEQ17065.1 amino acid ABC transporter substrate-binding protein, PAAT family [Thalassovita taeanensis]